MEEKFKALGHQVRLTIYRILRKETLCVCEINQLLDMSQPAVSQHLSLLTNAGLIEPEQRGQWRFYSPVEDAFEQAFGELIDEADSNILEKVKSVKQKNLCGMRNKKGHLPEEDSA